MTLSATAVVWALFPLLMRATLIGLDKAKSIAVQKAGLTLSEVTFTKAKLDYDSDGDKYEIEFFHGDYEYEVDVAAYSGTVLDYDVDSRWD